MPPPTIYEGVRVGPHRAASASALRFSQGPEGGLEPMLADMTIRLRLVNEAERVASFRANPIWRRSERVLLGWEVVEPVSDAGTFALGGINALARKLMRAAIHRGGFR